MPSELHQKTICYSFKLKNKFKKVYSPTGE